MTERIKYLRGVKYWLVDPYETQLVYVAPGVDIETDFIRLSASGRLLLRKGFAWNGASGPTWDDHTNMRGSGVHDALYELMAAGLLGPEWREPADMELRRIMVEDGMHPDRAEIWFNMVRTFGKKFACTTKPIYEAP